MSASDRLRPPAAARPGGTVLQVTWSWPGRLDTPRRRQGRWQPWQRRKSGVPGHGGPPARAAVPILCIPSDINNDGRFCVHAADARGPGLENLGV